MKEYGLTSCTIDLTEACNLACDYCFTHSKHEPRALTEDMLKRIINFWMPQTDTDETLSVAWWGGEPLFAWEKLKKYTLYVEEKAKELNRKVSFGGTTNGVYYTPEKVEWLKKHNSLMLVSLDGLKEQHDAHRCFKSGMGSWDIVVKNIKEAQRIAPVKIRMSIHADHVHQFAEAIKFAFEELNQMEVAYSPVVESNWTEEKFEILEQQFEEIVKYQISRMKQGLSASIKHINDEACNSHKGPRHPCGAGRHYMAWSVDGFGFPCHRFNKHGLTTEERFKAPMRIAEPHGDTIRWVNQDLKKQFDFVANTPPLCKECEIYEPSCCSGGCFATNYDLTGHVNLQDPKSCEFNKAQHHAGLLLKKLAEENGITLHPSNWSGQENRDKPIGCVCYNMCYLEGSKHEIIHFDPSSDRQCLCDHTNYGGSARPQHRTREQVKEANKLRKRFLGLSKQILETADLEKSEEQKKLEQDVLNKTIRML